MIGISKNESYSDWSEENRSDHEADNPGKNHTTSRDQGVFSACAIVDEMCDDLKGYQHSPDTEEMRSIRAAHIGEIVQEIRRKECASRVRPSGKLPGWGTLVEICASKDSNLGNVSSEFKGVHVVRIDKDLDWSK